MKFKILKKSDFRSFIPNYLLNHYRLLRDKKQFKDWGKNGCPVPPPHVVKQLMIAEYQKKFNISILIETGTYMGDMIEAQKKRFKRIISIELGKELYLKALTRFKKNINITIIHGDSGKVLPEILANINEKAIFWLDGHYSGGVTAKGGIECPIYEELSAIFMNSKLEHILLIDDARCFNGTNDYPTIQELVNVVKLKNSNYSIEIRNDIICCTPVRAD